jgi:4-oxalomesaconate tautomerase
MMQSSIPCTIMRGGTSKGLYFHAADLPADPETRNRVLLAAMGSPDIRQIDGLGGAHPLTSKVAILSPPSRPDADIDYLFLQVAVDKREVSDSQNCGNILAGVGPWAIEHGIIAAQDGITPVRIHMVNTQALAVARIHTPGGVVTYEGEARIDGVPDTAAPVLLEFLDVSGSSCGALLPTGSIVDTVEGVEVTCIDNGMPVVILRAADFGKTGQETPEQLEADPALCRRIEAIRLAIGPRMNLGDVAGKTVPKMSLVSMAQSGGTIATRTFIPRRVHEAIGVLGAVSVATACMLRGSVAAAFAPGVNEGQSGRIEVEHPTGFFTVELEFDAASPVRKVKRAALLRTARKLMSGQVYVPASVWAGR